MKKHWDEAFGDRRQEIVFIGLKSEIDEKKIRKELDACLVENYLDEPQKFKHINDPFPKWFEEDAA